MNKKQTKILLLLITIIIGVVIISGCVNNEENKIGEEGMNETNDYYPLEVGNQWVFAVKKETEGENPQNSITTVQITKKEMINNIETFVIEYETDNNTSQIEYVNKEYGKILCCRRISQGKEQNYYPLQLWADFSSLKKGKKWKWADNTINVELEGEILGKDVITVPAGTFETYIVKITTSPKDNVRGIANVKWMGWFAKNIGVVKEDAHIYANVSINNNKRLIVNTHIIAELKSYNISKK
ncbi:MAG: hypothetical protein CVT88_06120 [Candidatus Altiarchaeales archaeon HGW-Altiarchaeales-1]|nr:MAG: hypothetical protein CVT88_06120 [Candidatus Altiarchaeales archaeon HGW-Altiarchaeales-1]